MIAMIPLLMVWSFLLYKYPKYRQTFLVAGFFSGTVGHISVLLMFRYDWWQPISFMGNQITTLEDLILAGTNAGLVLIAWPLLTGIDYSETLKLSKKTLMQFVMWWLINLLFVYSLYLLGVHSFFASIIVYGIFISTVYMKRFDLIIPSFLSATIVTLGTIPFYVVIQWLNNSYAVSHYHLDKLIGATFLNIPIEDFVWYFSVNLLLAVSYHFIFETKFEDKKLSRSSTIKSIKNLFSLKKINE
ncbi:MAG: hypothetical protein KC414_06450 [Romboutsia sp.]|nr:hypothetical protein [Romboutsia sp.]